MSRFIYINGQYLPYQQASIHVEDRGFLFGDAVYEVIGCIHGYFADETAHLDRLERSLHELKMDMPVERETLRFLMREVLRRNHQTNAMIYIQISRGVAKRDFAFPAPETLQTLMIMTPNYDFDHNTGLLKGLRVKTVKDIRWKRRDIKSTLLLPQSMAKQEAIDSGYQEGWMVDDEGYVTEGTSNNAYIVKDGEIITRPVSCDILKGTTRSALQKICAEDGLRFIERAFTPEEAYEADEAFCSAATAQVTGIIEIDGHKIGDGKPSKITKQLFQHYRDYVNGLRGKQVHWEAGL